MKELLGFCKKYIVWIAAYLLSIAIFSLTLILYEAKPETILYPLVLSLFIFLIGFLYCYNRERQHLERVRRFIKEIETMEVDDPLERAYIEEVLKLRRQFRQQKSQHLSEKEEMVDFYTMWIHQIKTPIAALHLLLEENESLPMSIELLKIEQYVEMVLHNLRLQQGQKDLVIETFLLDDALREAIKTYSSIFIQKHLTLKFTPSDKEVLTDRKWLIFVVEQLLSNALKYTREGEIRVYFENDLLTIQDTGIGIESDDLPRVFEKGYTGRVGRSQMQATGLGLYLSKKILDHLGHEIFIHSKVGVGTSVSIDLKRKERVLE